MNQIKYGEIDCMMVAWQILCAILERTDEFNEIILNSELVDLALVSCDAKEDPLLQQVLMTDLALLLSSVSASQMKRLAPKKVIEFVFEDPLLYSSPSILTAALQNIINVGLYRRDNG